MIPKFTALARARCSELTFSEARLSARDRLPPKIATGGFEAFGVPEHRDAHFAEGLVLTIAVVTEDASVRFDRDGSKLSNPITILRRDARARRISELREAIELTICTEL